jgi:Protein of unknown function (DUF2970).
MTGARTQRMSWLHIIRTVAWSFIGIRSGSEATRVKLNPFLVVAVALAGVALFVGGLALLVHWVVGG